MEADAEGDKLEDDDSLVDTESDGRLVRLIVKDERGDFEDDGLFSEVNEDVNVACELTLALSDGNAEDDTDALELTLPLGETLEDALSVGEVEAEVCGDMLYDDESLVDAEFEGRIVRLTVTLIRDDIVRV